MPSTSFHRTRPWSSASSLVYVVSKTSGKWACTRATPAGGIGSWSSCIACLTDERIALSDVISPDTVTDLPAAFAVLEQIKAALRISMVAGDPDA